MGEKAYLGLSKNVALGLAYLIPLVAIVLLIAEKGLDREEKAMLLSSILNIIAASVTCGIFGIIGIVAAVKAFMNDYSFKLPLLYSLSESIIGKQ